MNLLTGITNLTNWMGNVIMPTLAALFFALGVLRYAHGQAHTYAPWAGFLCLMVSGVLRGIEKFAAHGKLLLYHGWADGLMTVGAPRCSAAALYAA